MKTVFDRHVDPLLGVAAQRIVTLTMLPDSIVLLHARTIESGSFVGHRHPASERSLEVTYYSSL